MIDDGILFDYGSLASYHASVQRVRDKVAIAHSTYHILADRRTNSMRRFAVAIFDETGAADIDVCLFGNTLYILAVRLAERDWFCTANQAKEFGSCKSSIAFTLPFEGGYGTLGIINNFGVENFKREHASRHVAAMKAYMLACAAGQSGATDATACKCAFAYFAMTIAEAARFSDVEALMDANGIPPAATIAALQRWVIDSSVKDSVFPTNRIAIAGVHEQRSGKIWKDLVENLKSHPNLGPSDDDLSGNSAATKQFLLGEGNFVDAGKTPKGSTKTGAESGREFLLSAYFLDRVKPGTLRKAQIEFEKLAAAAKPVLAVQLAGLKIPD